ncbi:MAG: phosphotransferase [Propionibacterium sp.]|nr:phosphotransferase [Propionibacterium sp.]MDN6793458.1 phosphotransferase [Propionibacterium sp.]
MSGAFPAEEPGGGSAHSCDVAPSVLAALEDEGLVEHGVVTRRGLDALEPYRVDNAVILAAGMSTRFVPLSYETPKGLLEVCGEILVERQIRQLRSAGVDDITVVVGYMADRFRYLAERFDVRIVENPDYRTRNNNSSLWCVRETLGNTYVCSSDNYFAGNPFRRFVAGAYYASEYVAGRTEEWCLDLSPDDSIEGVTVGGGDAWVMLGHVFFDRTFSETFVRILEQEYEEPSTAGKLWEQIYAEHLPELHMRAKKYEPGFIHEFDSLDDLELFDPEFINHVDSPILDHIESVLGCRRTDIHDCWPLSEGLTNLSFHFCAAGEEYVYRHPGVGTESMIDRASETAALVLARRLGLDDTFIHEDPAEGWKLSRYIPRARSLDPENPIELRRAMELCRKLHDSGAVLERSFDFFEESLRYEELLTQHNSEEVPGFRTLRAKIDRIKAHTVADAFPVCLNHNDFFPLNILVDEDQELTLIDWEYAGMSDVTNDLATFTVCAQLRDETAEQALRHYHGRAPTFEERRHFWAYVALAGWCWYVWALAKEAQGDDVGDWLEVYRAFAEDNVDRVLGWYEQSATRPAGIFAVRVLEGV